MALHVMGEHVGLWGPHESTAHHVPCVQICTRLTGW